MRVAVVGAGAIGGTIGGLLAARGAADVELVARGDHLAALQRKGLELVGVPGVRVVRVAAAERLTGRADLIVLAVKAQDLAAAARSVAGAAAGSTVLTIQNGLDPEGVAARELPSSPIVGGVTNVVADFLEPGRVLVKNLGGLALGRPTGPPDDVARAVGRLLERAGIPAFYTGDLRGARWTKLMGNLNNAFSAATGQALQELYEDPRVLKLAVRMLREGLAVARAEGVRLAPIPWLSPRTLRVFSHLPAGLAGRVLRRHVRAVGVGGPILGSTLQSLRRGRATEIDYLNGEVVTRGRPHGVPVQVNATLVDAIRGVERGEPFLSPAELLRRAD